MQKTTVPELARPALRWHRTKRSPSSIWLWKTILTDEEIWRFLIIHAFFLIQNIDFAKPCPLHSPWSISPLRVRLKARLVHWYRFRRIMADLDFRIIKVEVLSFKTSISRNHAHCILHNRFPPFGFVWRPVWPIGIVSEELGRILTWGLSKLRFSFSKHRFRETMPIAFSIVDFPPSGSFEGPFGPLVSFQKSYDGSWLQDHQHRGCLIQNIDFAKPRPLHSP